MIDKFTKRKINNKFPLFFEIRKKHFHPSTMTGRITPKKFLNEVGELMLEACYKGDKNAVVKLLRENPRIDLNYASSGFNGQNSLMLVCNGLLHDHYLIFLYLFATGFKFDLDHRDLENRTLDDFVAKNAIRELLLPYLWRCSTGPQRAIILARHQLEYLGKTFVDLTL